MEKITINGVEYMLTPIENESPNSFEPKFKVGNWYQCIKDFFGKGVTFDKNTAYYCAKEGCLQNEYGCHIAIVKDLYDNFKLWTIKDAKPGDILFHSDSASNGIFIFKELLKYEFSEKVICYCDYDSEDHFCLGEHHTCCWADAKILHPATKEQRDILFQKMKEAGYEWDAEKKELKKCTPIFTVGDTIIKKPVSDINFGFFTITDIAGGKYWYNDRIICEISEQNDWELVKQKPAERESETQPKQGWSEEDEKIFDEIVGDIEALELNTNSENFSAMCKKEISWLKSIKNRIQQAL